MKERARSSVLLAIFNKAVIVSALGYFVDIFDLIIYGIVRVESLRDLGLTKEDIDVIGEILLRWQMAGFLLGGILWGVLGDKLGRKTILFGSITLYSVATLLNAFVVNTWQYAVCRFFAGLGLAGELGAAITLSSEILAPEIRTYATTFIASLGLLGAVFANFLKQYLTWQEIYIVGGIMGLLLLLLRFGILEPQVFQKAKHMGISRGNFLALFSSWGRFSRYMTTILVALPIWYLIGVLVTFAQEMALSMNVKDAHLISSSNAISWAYLGGCIGDIICGLLSQYLKKRRVAILIWLICGSIALILYFVLMPHLNYQWYYVFSFLFGFFIGYWTVFVTISAEQFGTNLRATVAVTSPNFIRGSLIIITFLFRELIPYFGRAGAAAIVGALCYIIAFLSLWKLKETFGRNLDFLEET